MCLKSADFIAIVCTFLQDKTHIFRKCNLELYRNTIYKY